MTAHVSVPATSGLIVSATFIAAKEGFAIFDSSQDFYSICNTCEYCKSVTIHTIVSFKSFLGKASIIDRLLMYGLMILQIHSYITLLSQLFY